MFLHHFVCSVHFPTVQKHTGFETIPHLYWKNDKGVKPANGFQPAFSGHSVHCRSVRTFFFYVKQTRNNVPPEEPTININRSTKIFVNFLTAIKYFRK